MSKSPQFTIKNMPEELDQKIQASFRGDKNANVQQEQARQISEPSNWLMMWRAAFAASLCLVVVFWQNAETTYAEAELRATIVSNDLLEQLKSSNHILYQKFTVSEGRDKSLIVARINDLEPSVTQQVETRTDTVEVWSHGITARVDAAKNINDAPRSRTLNLENKDHLHLFVDQKAECISGDIHCGAVKLSEEAQAHRRLFDAAHNIGGIYDHQFEPKLSKSFDELGLMQLITQDDRFVVFRDAVADDQRIDYYFHPETFEREKEVTSVLYEGQWYEMSIKEYGERTLVAPEEFGVIFDAADDAYVQQELIPLTS